MRRLVQAGFTGAAFVLGILLLWQGSALFLLIVAAILLAGVSEPLTRALSVFPLGVLVVTLMLLSGAAAVAGLVLTGPQPVAQSAQLGDSVTHAARSVEAWAMSIDAVEQTVGSSSFETGSSLPDISGVLGGVVCRAIGATFGAPLPASSWLPFLGLYLALSPALYVEGTVRLMPVTRRTRTCARFYARRLRRCGIGCSAWRCWTCGIRQPMGVLFGVSGRSWRRRSRPPPRS